VDGGEKGKKGLLTKNSGKGVTKKCIKGPIGVIVKNGRDINPEKISET